ncbi:MAG: hypothetical protein ACPGO3_13785 [Magnetospiraceae bacterium]
MGHIVVDISGHGFGHAAQVGPVLKAFVGAYPQTRLTIRAAIPDPILDQALGIPFDRAPPAPEACMVMHGPTRLDVLGSIQAYLQLHKDWDRLVDQEAARLAALAPDLLFADAPYLTIIAAAVAGIPVCALCSFGWDQILRPYAADFSEIGSIVDRITASYGMAKAFMRCEPALMDANLKNVMRIGPVGRTGVDRRRWLTEVAGIPDTERVVVVSFGGVAGGWNLHGLPEVPGVTWLLGHGRLPARRDVLSCPDLDLRFIDAIASADAVFTKSGYGTFVEAAHHGARVLYIDRPDWAEATALEGWIDSRGVATRLMEQNLTTGRLADATTATLAQPRREAIPYTGIDTAVAVLSETMLRE